MKTEISVKIQLTTVLHKYINKHYIITLLKLYIYVRGKKEYEKENCEYMYLKNTFKYRW